MLVVDDLAGGGPMVGEAECLPPTAKSVAVNVQIFSSLIVVHLGPGIHFSSWVGIFADPFYSKVQGCARGFVIVSCFSRFAHLNGGSYALDILVDRGVGWRCLYPGIL